jgi:exo-beta-1,3-glucanase (GH17 family)
MPKPATPFLLPRLLLGALVLATAFYANWRGWEWAGRLQQVDYAEAASHAALPDRVASVSFAPFRRGQSPLTKTYPTHDEIDADLKAAAIVARGVRTYTSREGLEAVPELAGKYGLDVIHSAWLGREPDINEAEVTALIEQANKHPDTIKRVIVGNEVLLRKDLTVDQLIQQIRRVKAAVKQPVSYADVWEFWLRYPQLLNEVDFVTVHFLPYWEDIPIGVAHAMPHIKGVMDQVRAGLPGKPILVGEVGWPSLGRSRREAIPSRPEAARFNLEFLRLAEKEGFD